jgi:hypothetical protein
MTVARMVTTAGLPTVPVKYAAGYPSRRHPTPVFALLVDALRYRT